MILRPLRIFVLVALVAWLAAGPECFGALAQQVTGTKRFTGRLSSNKALRKQQLIVDPEGIIGGSVSVNYDNRVVRLVEVIDPGEFEVTAGKVSVLSAIGGLSPFLLPLDQFLAAQPSDAALAPADVPAAEYRELGFVQIFFESRNTAALRASGSGNSVIDNLPGYVTVFEDGPTGINDTHALVFEYLPGIPDSELARYTIFATPPREQTVPDSITLADDPDNPISYRDLGPARLGGSLVYDEPKPRPVPVPSAVAAGGMLLGAIALKRWLARSRR